MDVMPTLMPGRRIARCCIPLPRGLKADDGDERYCQGMKRVSHGDRSMTRRGLMALLAGGPVALLSGCGGANSIRYRLTLEVETPEGTKTGSGVIEHMARHNDGFFRDLGAGAGLAVGTRGEAVIVDLGARGLLLCLLTRDIA